MERRRAPAAPADEGHPARPFLKWAGGKSQLLADIAPYYPFDRGCTRYVEPFAGAGAVLFDILNRYRLESVYVGDCNAELVNAYLCLRDETEEVIGRLKRLQQAFWPLDREARKAMYLERRALFNSLKDADTKTRELARTRRAALLIFLNKTCFNGLYRENARGHFNVPAGSARYPAICDADNLRAVARCLQGVDIVCAGYERCLKVVDNKTFVYLDPPYRPLSASASFTAYTATSFDDTRQKELAELVARLDKRGARFLLSNSDPRNIDPQDDFFDRLYAAYTIRRVEARRSINSRGSARGPVRELLVSNFAPGGLEEDHAR